MLLWLSSLSALLLLLFTGCSHKSTGSMRYENIAYTMRPYEVNGILYYPQKSYVGERFLGTASWYGEDFHGKKTSNGETYDMYDYTVAHKTLPMNTMVKITNLSNRQSVIARVNDRGPFVANRVVDVSKSIATKLAMIEQGTARVALEVIGLEGIIGQKRRAQKSYAVQIGSFGNKLLAQKEQERHSYGYYTALVKESVRGDKILYRVLLDGFANEQEARAFIASSHLRGAFVVIN